MSSSIVTLRDEIYTRILLNKTLTNYSDNSFDIEKTWKPYSELTSIQANPKVWVVGGVPGDADNKSRTNMVLREHQTMIGIQKGLGSGVITTEIDNLTLLVEEIEETCRTEVSVDLFKFTRLEFLKDENGTPFSFTMLRKAYTFEAYFTVYYNKVYS
jgi:hypothetical protein